MKPHIIINIIIIIIIIIIRAGAEPSTHTGHPPVW